jgi:hypothetical protein
LVFSRRCAGLVLFVHALGFRADLVLLEKPLPCAAAGFVVLSCAALGLGLPYPASAPPSVSPLFPQRAAVAFPVSGCSSEL